ncbi:MAG: nucleotide exchange factor GrpE [Waddliaceae bacterium]
MTEQKKINEKEESLQEEVLEKEEGIKEVSIQQLELEQLRRDSEEYKHKYLSLLADTENARKRLNKEKKDLMQYATENLLLDILHPLDHLENALKFTEQASKEVQHWATGFQMILTNFKDVLRNNNIRPIDAEGKSFDPHYHEAIEVIETDEYEPGTIVEVTSKGYLIGEKTLRPAKVKVAKELQKMNKENEDG